MKKRIKKIGGAWFFLIIMIIIYLTVWLFSSDLVVQTIRIFWQLFLKMVPVLAVVFLTIYLINWLLKPEKVKKHLGEDAGIKGLLFVIFGGIISVGSIYLWYPLLAELRQHGMSNKLIAVFLYNRAIKIPLLPMLLFYFDLKFTITLTVLIILFSLLVGWTVDKISAFEKKERTNQ